MEKHPEVKVDNEADLKGVVAKIPPCQKQICRWRDLSFVDDKGSLLPQYANLTVCKGVVHTCKNGVAC